MTPDERAADLIPYAEEGSGMSLVRLAVADAIREAEAAERERCVAEIERLKRGDFTPDEFQALCHHRDEKPGCTFADFTTGCRDYQRKLFGRAEGDEVVDRWVGPDPIE